VVSPCAKPDLVAVNNGLYDYGNKILMDFDPELVFTSKIGTDFVEDAPNPVIRNNEDGTDWDVVTWMDELSDDPKVVELLWQVLGAVVRPNVDWNVSVNLFFTSFAKQARRSRKGGFTGCANVFSPIPVTA